MKIKAVLRIFLLLGLTLGLFRDCIPAKEPNRKKPNLVFILLDDLGKEWVSVYGAENIETPVIDKLASEGMLFSNAYSMPQCTPSRVALMTGQYLEERMDQPLRCAQMGTWCPFRP